MTKKTTKKTPVKKANTTAKKTTTTKKIDPKKVVEKKVTTPKKEEKKGYFNEFISTINDLIDYFYKKSSKEILKVVLEIIVLVIFISLLKLPFILFRDLLLSFFDVFGIHGNTFAAILIYRLVDITYIIIAVILFINIFKKRFKGINKTK